MKLSLRHKVILVLNKADFQRHPTFSTLQNILMNTEEFPSAFQITDL